MGSSKSFRAAPGWESQNTPRGKSKVSGGPVVKPEGTHMSGSNDYGRMGMKNSARNKSKQISGGSAKNKGPYGRS